jgi:hypothetical protein
LSGFTLKPSGSLRTWAAAGIEHDEVLAAVLDHKTLKTIRTPGTHRSTGATALPKNPKGAKT